MLPDRTTPSSPASEMPEARGDVRAPAAIPSTLAVRLGPVVDRARQIAANLGVRTHRVWLTHVEWPSSRRGVGEPLVTSRREILPAPRVRVSTSFILRAIGNTEDGTIFIDKISARYSEGDLTGRTPDLADPAMPATGARNHEFFWEVQETRPTEPQPAIRRYIPTVVPELRQPGGWSLTLNKQDYNRMPGAVPHPPGVLS